MEWCAVQGVGEALAARKAASMPQLPDVFNRPRKMRVGLPT
jgi:hypothetical protein